MTYKDIDGNPIPEPPIWLMFEQNAERQLYDSRILEYLGSDWAEFEKLMQWVWDHEPSGEIVPEGVRVLVRLPHPETKEIATWEFIYDSQDERINDMIIKSVVRVG